MNRKVILILCDGMRPDAMENLPYVKEFMKKSAYTMKAETVFPSVTLPCHMSLFLGVPPERHGITTNLYMPPVRPVNGIIEQLKVAKKTSAVFFDWEQLRDLWRPGNITYSRFEAGHTAEIAAKNTDDAIRYISENSPDFVFLYIGYPDGAGHDFGWMTDEYMESVRASWEQIARVVEKFEGEYTFIITADHGGHDRIHGTEMPEDMIIPFMAMGPDFVPGEIKGQVNIMDITPTIARLTGVDCADEWEGKSLI
ncbi:MAG: alkaline phosphatase family protein [Oscillospiraceae bacterium]|nr:alkaline phosphatase family protein [Oscillospiraceae bacterium]